MKVDFIIVGQGLAGTLLTYELISLGKSVVVFDDPDQPKASDVAAGLINPVVFRRMTKSWLVDDVFAVMESTYRKLENLLHESFYFATPIHRVLSETEAGQWNEKRTSNQLEKYADIAPDKYFNHAKLISPFGTAQIKKAGRLDLQKLISAFAEYLKPGNSLLKEKFRVEKLQIHSGKVIYENLEAEKVIFCDGPAAAQNPYFKNLKFKSSKGEVLELKIPELDLTEIVSQEIFVMPLGKDLYKIGATYSWDELDFQITTSARNELLDKFAIVIEANPKIINQKAGIRPTMHDRKPVIGVLPEFSQIGIFNGFGSKGALWGPFFALQFARFLTGLSDNIHSEVNVLRYFRKK